jgi:hypothetical protein
MKSLSVEIKSIRRDGKGRVFVTWSNNSQNEFESDAQVTAWADDITEEHAKKLLIGSLLSDQADLTKVTGKQSMTIDAAILRGIRGKNVGL